jgi:hypothetical protein
MSSQQCAEHIQTGPTHDVNDGCYIIMLWSVCPQLKLSISDLGVSSAPLLLPK